MIPLDELRQHLRVEHDQHDASIARLERSAVAYVQKRTGHYFGSVEEVTEYFSAPGGDKPLWLREVPREGSLVVERTEDWSTWETVDSGDYYLDGFGLYHTTEWPYGLTMRLGVPDIGRNLRATYEHGFEPGEEPDDIRQAVLMAVAHWYEHPEAVTDGPLTEVPIGVEAILTSYWNVRV